jgi:copper(I)-binding protein
MHYRSLASIAAALLASAFSLTAQAHDYKIGDMRILHPYARATAPNQPAGAAYLTIDNQGRQAEKLIAASSSIANSVEIHSMSMDGNVMKMREVPHIELKPSAKVEMKPGDGFHIMLVGLKQALKAGDKFPLVLTFEKAGTLEVSVSVEDHAPKPVKQTDMHHH